MFSGKNRYIKSSKAFLFSLNSNVKMMSTKHPQYSAYNGANYGPTFGGGHDLYIVNNCRHSRSSYTNLGHSYNVPSRFSSQKRNLLAGSYNFYCAEYEVYYLTTESQRRKIKQDLINRHKQHRRLSRTLKSSIIMKNKSQKLKTRLYDFIRGLSGQNKEWTKCFTASRHHYQSQDFHKHCDNKGPTIVLISSGSHIFGGYNPSSWNCKYNYSEFVRFTQGYE